MILGEMLSYSLQRFPDKTAIIFEGDSWTYRQVDERVRRLAIALSTLGLRKNHKVAILARNSHRFLELSIALARLGIWMVAINHRLRVDEIAMRLRHSDASAIFIDPEFSSVITAMDEDIHQALGRRRIAMGGTTPAGFLDYEALIDAASGEPPDVDVGPGNPLYLGYTSGTTGRSKAAIVSHRAIMAGFLYKTVEYRLDSSDVTLNPGNFWHSAPRDFALLQLYLGGTTVVTRDFDAEQCLRLIESQGVTNGFFVPTMFRMMLDVPGNEAIDTSSLKVILSGGAPLPTALKHEVIERFGPVVHEFYGATETRIVASIRPEEISDRRRSVGRLGRDIRVRILGDDGAQLPVGEIGDIYLQSPTLFSGYYKDEEKTRAAFRGDWFTLGDMGRVDEDGYLYLVDRRNDVVISGGENIYPSEIEEVLLQHPAVSDSAVIGVPDKRWGEALKAFICVRDGQSVDVEELARFCADRLPGYMKPRSFEMIAELPRNPTGKVLKRELRAPYWRDQEAGV